MLTEKKRAFADEYIKVKNATQAYKNIYDCENSNYQVIRNKASQLLNDDDVKQYIEQITKRLQTEVVNTVMLDRENKKKLIEQRIKHCITTGDDTAIARYLDILNKMDSEYIQKTENTNTTTVLTGLDTETLKELIK